MSENIKCYNVGIVGFGMIGKVHAYAHATLPYHLENCPCRTRITHVVTGRRETAEAARAFVGADVASNDWRDVCENPEIDIVHICTPNHLHLDPLLAAMRQNKHIYCEKPLVNSMPEAEQVRELIGEYQATAQMVFHNRFYPATMRAKQLVDDGAIGEVLEFRASYMQGSHANPDAPFRWKTSAAFGGGVIADIASHAIDMTEHLTGRFAEVMAATHIGFPQRHKSGESQSHTVDAEDSVVITARLPSGALGSIQATKLAAGTENELTFEIFGTQGSLRYDGMDPHHLWYFDASQPESPCGGRHGWVRIDAGHRYATPDTTFPATKSNIGWLRAHASCLANFMHAVTNQRAATPDLRRGIEVQHILESVRKSDQQRRWVELGDYTECTKTA